MSRQALAVEPSLAVRPGVERAYLPIAAVLFLWLLTWIVLSWPYTLDDALIHLRYADHLLHEHRITYDGVHASFGTSSLLYVSLLAALRVLSTSPLLPRVVSSIVYVAFFVLLAFALYRDVRDGGTQPAAVWMMALALIT